MSVRHRSKGRTVEDDGTYSGDHPNVLVWPPVLFAGAVGLAWLAGLMLPLDFLQTYGVAGWQFWLGLVIAILGVFLGLSGILAFRRAGTHVHPNHPALVVVRDGPYRMTRNPMYLGAVLFLIGLALFASLEWLVLLIPPVVAILHIGVILREERYMLKKFGTEYSDYLARTHRWL